MRTKMTNVKLDDREIKSSVVTFTKRYNVKIKEVSMIKSKNN